MLILALILNVCILCNFVRSNPNPEWKKINECARYAVHYTAAFAEAMISDCNIHSEFDDLKLASILSGTDMKPLDVPLSFKKLIVPVQFSVPSEWKGFQARLNKAPEKKSSRFFGLFGDKPQMEGPTQYYASNDGKFLISPISKREYDDFKEGIRHYYQHFARNPNSLLVRTVGMFQVGSLYYVIYLAPFPVRNPPDFLVFEFSSTSTEDLNEFQAKGLAPYGALDWHRLTCDSAAELEDFDSQSFLENLASDLDTLVTQKAVNYQFLIAIPTSESREILGPLPYDPYFDLRIEDVLLSASVSITHFFTRTRKAEKHLRYVESFDVFRKTKVVYCNSEGRIPLSVKSISRGSRKSTTSF